MAHFAELDRFNIVQMVVVVGDADCLDDNGVESEAVGIAFLQSLFDKDKVWRQTSYNTTQGQHTLGGTPFRKNYACIGYTYDAVRDAFIPPKMFPSWILNEETCWWEPPFPHPDDGAQYIWDESLVDWIAVE